MLKEYKQKQKVKKILRKQEKLSRRLASVVKVCGSGLKVFGEITVYSPEKIRIGTGCKINMDVYINALSGVTIGDNSTISVGAKIISSSYDVEHWMRTGERVHITDKPIHIGNNCWIGANAIILPGVKITGEYVVIGAGAVVTKDVTESRVLVAGNPAKIVKHYEVNNQE